MTPELCNRVASPEMTEMLRTMPTDHAHSITSTRLWQLFQIQPEFAPSVREKRKSSDSLAVMCHQVYFPVKCQKNAADL